MIGWNACGCVMDVSPRIYRSNFRPFRGRPDIVIPGRWHWCPPGAKALPFWHAMGSMCQDQTPRLGTTWNLGEIPQWEGIQTHVPNSRYTGQHWCGSAEDWQQGAVWGRRLELDREGVPFCCRAEPIRVGGAEVIIAPRQFSLFDALWWLQYNVLTYSFGQPVTSWINSDPSTNPALGQGDGGGPDFNGQGVWLGTHPLQGREDYLIATHPFVLSAATWYMVGGGYYGFNTFATLQIAGRSAIGQISFEANSSYIAAYTTQRRVQFNWDQQGPPYGIYSLQWDGQRIRIYFNGQFLADDYGGPCATLQIGGFLGGNITPVLEANLTTLSEFLLFDKVLSPQDDFTVLNYLSNKYSIPLAPQPALPDNFCLWWRPDQFVDTIRSGAWWLRPDSFMCPYEGLILNTWTDASQATDDAVNPSPTTAPTLDNQHLQPTFVAAFTFGQYLEASSRIQLSGDLTIYVVAATDSGGVPVGPHLGSLFGGNPVGLSVDATSITYSDTAQSHNVSYPLGVQTLTIYEVRRGNGVVELRVNGQLLGSFTDALAGVLKIERLSPARSSGSWSGSVWIAEVIVSRACYTDDEDAAVVNYLLGKYSITVGTGAYFSPVYYAPVYFAPVYF